MSASWWAKRLAIVAVVLLCALNWVAYFDIQLVSDTTRMLELRPFGYSYEEAEAFSYALQFSSMDAHRDVYLPLDFALIACLVGLIVSVSLWSRPHSLWWGPVVFALLFAAADITENLLMVQIFARKALDAQITSWASMATQMKFGSLALALISAFALWRAKRRTQ